MPYTLIQRKASENGLIFPTIQVPSLEACLRQALSDPDDFVIQDERGIVDYELDALVERQIRPPLRSIGHYPSCTRRVK